MGQIENKHDGWPERFSLLPYMTSLRRFVMRCTTLLPLEAPDYMSDHYRGAEALLSDHDDLDRQSLLDANLSGFGYEDTDDVFRYPDGWEL